MRALSTAAMFCLALASIVPVRATAATAPAMPMNMPMPQTRVARDPQLFASLLSAGGTPFHTARLLSTLTAGRPGEIAALEREFGAAKVTEFDHVFDLAVAESTPRPATPLPPAIAPSRLARALYRAGLEHGTFEIERLFDRLLGPAAHDRAMSDVARRYGGSGETLLHAVLTSLLSDLAAPKASSAK